MKTEIAKHRRRATLLGFASGIAILTAADAAWAQDPSRESGAALEEVVVTAQRREERLQDVPITVTAVTETALAKANATDMRTLFLAVPSMRSSNGPAGQSMYTIRGLGGGAGGGNNVGEEPSVAMYVDGFYIPNTYAGLFGLANVERVEVLKGPQGTLFGRNASAGVIQVVTSRPSKVLTGKFSAAYENYDRLIAQGYLSGPITENLYYGISADLDRQGKGWGHNYATGRDANYQSNNGLRLKLLYEPNDTFSTVLSADASRRFTTNGSTAAGVPGGKISLLNITDPRVGPYDSQQNFIGLGLDVHQWGVQNTTTFDLGGVTITNLAQYRYSHANQLVDPDYGPTNFINVTLEREDKFATEELQIAGSIGDKLDWIVGGFYMYYKSGYPGPQGVRQFGAALGALTDLSIRGQTLKSVAAFGQASYNLTDATRITAGLRYTADWRDYHFIQYITAQPQPPFARSKSDESNPSWRLAIDHKLTPDVMVFASYNRGVKSGAIDTNNAPNPAIPPLKAEKLDAYEVGIKSDLLDRRVRLNASLFYYNFSNYQTSILTTNAFGALLVTPVNASGAKLKGLDFELEARPVDDLSLSFAGTYIDSKFKRYQGVPTTRRNANGLGTTTYIDATGQPLPGVSKFTATVSARYDIHMEAGVVTPSVQLYHSGRAFSFADLNLPPSTQFPAGSPAQREYSRKSYQLLNASLSFAPEAGDWTVRAYVNNLTDEVVVSRQISSLADIQIPMVGPRTYGAAISYRF